VAVKTWAICSEDIGVKIASRNAMRVQRLTELAQVAEHEMKLLAPWTNQTGAARARLHARVVTTPATWAKRGEARPMRINVLWMLAQGVWYGEFLEYRWGGKYAIVNPTAQRYRPYVKRAIRGPFAVPASMTLHSGPPNPINAQMRFQFEYEQRRAQA
jgi:hypothetical protein